MAGGKLLPGHLGKESQTTPLLDLMKKFVNASNWILEYEWLQYAN